MEKQKLDNSRKVIAEFCQNHNGDYEILKEMIWAAAESGATHGKIQSMFADDLSFRERFEEGNADDKGQIITIKRPYKDEYNRLKGLEINYKQHEDFIKECEKASIIPMTTLFNLDRINDIYNLGFKVIKVASYDCGSFPLITSLANKFNEIIVSTGATYDHEIKETINILNQTDINYSLLHCVTIYPTKLEHFHLGRLEVLNNLCNNIGFSDHSLVSRDGILGTLAAIYMGASIIERHFTILDEHETKDGPVSIGKEHIKEIINFTKLDKDDQLIYINEKGIDLNILKGNKDRELSSEELLNRDYYRGRFINKYRDSTVYNWEEDAKKLDNYLGMKI